MKITNVYALVFLAILIRCTSSNEIVISAENRKDIERYKNPVMIITGSGKVDSLSMKNFKNFVTEIKNKINISYSSSPEKRILLLTPHNQILSVNLFKGELLNVTSYKTQKVITNEDALVLCNSNFIDFISEMKSNGESNIAELKEGSQGQFKYYDIQYSVKYSIQIILEKYFN